MDEELIYASLLLVRRCMRFLRPRQKFYTGQMHTRSRPNRGIIDTNKRGIAWKQNCALMHRETRGHLFAMISPEDTHHSMQDKHQRLTSAVREAWSCTKPGVQHPVLEHHPHTPRSCATSAGSKQPGEKTLFREVKSAAGEAVARARELAERCQQDIHMEIKHCSGDRATFSSSPHALPKLPHGK